LVPEPVLPVGAKALDVDGVFTHQLGDLLFHRGRQRVLVLVGVGREEAAHADPVDLPRRETGWYADDVGALAFTGDLVPDRQLADRPGVDEAGRVVGVVRAVAETVHAE